MLPVSVRLVLVLFSSIRIATTMELDESAHWFGKKFRESSDVLCMYEHLAWKNTQARRWPVTTLKVKRDLKNKLLAHVWCLDTAPPQEIPTHEVQTDGPFPMFCVTPAPLLILPELKTPTKDIFGSKAFCIPESRKAHIMVGKLEYRCLDTALFDNTWSTDRDVFVLAWTQIVGRDGEVKFVRQSSFDVRRVNSDYNDNSNDVFSKRLPWKDTARNVPAALWYPGYPKALHASNVSLPALSDCR